MSELAGLVVLDASTSLAGAYCAKLFADAGASVTLLEPADGAARRRWSWDRGLPAGEDGALFRYLRHGQRSVAAASHDLLAGADIVLTSGRHPARDRSRYRGRAPGPGGRFAHAVRADRSVRRPASHRIHRPGRRGAIAIRGTADRPPFQMGGRIVEWVAGAYAAVAALASARRLARTGARRPAGPLALRGRQPHRQQLLRPVPNLAGRPPLTRPARTVELPSIEPTADGWVGFNTNTREQFDSFCLLIERPDLLEADWWKLATRQERADEWNALVREWTTQHSTAEIVERAALLRIPVAPVSDGPAVLELEQALARGVFLDDPTGTFRCRGGPGASTASRPRRRSRRLRSGSTITSRSPGIDPRPTTPATRTAPLDGITVVDLTAWWAGPSATGHARGARRRRHPRRVGPPHRRHADGGRHVLRPRAVVGVQRVLPAGEHQQVGRHARPRYAAGARRSCCAWSSRPTS